MNTYTHEMLSRLEYAGVAPDDALALRRIAMTLHRWHELYCGTSDGHIERDEQTGKPRYYNARARYVDPKDPRAWRSIPDRETGALKRLAAIMKKYPTLKPYIQTDPRGAPLYILRPGDVPTGGNTDSYYTNGVCVHG